MERSAGVQNKTAPSEGRRRRQELEWCSPLLDMVGIVTRGTTTRNPAAEEVRTAFFGNLSLDWRAIDSSEKYVILRSQSGMPLGYVGRLR